MPPCGGNWDSGWYYQRGRLDGFFIEVQVPIDPPVGCSRARTLTGTLLTYGPPLRHAPSGSRWASVCRIWRHLRSCDMCCSLRSGPHTPISVGWDDVRADGLIGASPVRRPSPACSDRVGRPGRRRAPSRSLPWRSFSNCAHEQVPATPSRSLVVGSRGTPAPYTDDNGRSSHGRFGGNPDRDPVRLQRKCAAVGDADQLDHTPGTARRRGGHGTCVAMLGHRAGRGQVVGVCPSLQRYADGGFSEGAGGWNVQDCPPSRLVCGDEQRPRYDGSRNLLSGIGVERIHDSR